MLYEYDGVASVGHLVEEGEEALDVVEVEPVGGLVDDVELALVVEVVGELDALELATREGGHRLVEVEVAEPHLGESLELRLERLPLEERERLVDGEVHHFGDGLAFIAMAESFVVVAGAVTDIADGFDGLHESHIGDDDALAAAGGTGTLAVEGEELDGLAAGFGEEFPYGVGDIQIGGGSATQVDAYVVLADEDWSECLIA